MERNCTRAGHALIERVNTRRIRFASKKSIFARLFGVHILFFRPGFTMSTCPHLALSSFTTEFANPYLASRTVSQQTSLTDFTPMGFRDPLLRHLRRRIHPFFPFFLSFSLLRSSGASPIATFFGKSF